MSARISSVRLLGEIAEFRNGVNFSADNRSGSDVAFIGVGDFQGNERLRQLDQLERIARPSSLDKASLLKQGDLIFVRSNGNRALIGRCMKIEGVDGPLTHSGFTIRARLTDGSIDPEWVTQFFATGLAKRAIARQGGGTNISNLSQDMLRGIPIPVPKAAFQAKFLAVAKQLVGVTDALDDIIDAKREFKRGLAQQLLTGQKRFPKFRSSKWITKSIGDLFEEVERRVDWDDEAEYRLVSIRRRSGGMFLREVKRGSDIKTKQMFVVHAGDVVISRMQVVHGALAIVPPELDGCHVSGTYFVLTPKKGAAVSPAFFDCLSHLPRMYHAALISSYGVHIEKMTFNPEWYLQTKIRVPSVIDEQKRIVEALRLADAELALLEAQRENYSLYKRGLLACLLSGELPVAP